ncbi:carboxypeptidase-like regulatory domain-containing protein [Longimicrobium sp.]|uniref:carboxypeptidase-like regulatory domain-containing protein n=1 Tax=Longimicrobium sp. TaxID=2029185 RepID=UPI002C40D71C|nr:carboxypeptidase-like regulatory domain-containing protein [Longimicrobium sp.]HSU16117.1 carboxypeptidase-like regulatory domain-containing protein [Longimicrobium sp.]
MTRRALAAAAVALASSAAACLPIPHWETGSPRLVGRVTREDGTPVAGARIAVTHHAEDATCARPTGAATTDAGGRFELPRGRRFEPVVLFFGDWTHGYRVCAGAAPPLGEAYYWNSFASVPRSDSIACVERGGPGRTTVTCATRRDRWRHP